MLSTIHPAPVEEVHHGVVVSDPFRWLEDRTLPETEEWIGEQKVTCDSYFKTCADLDEIRERVRRYLDVEIVDQPVRVGDRYFYRRRASGQEQGCLYVRDAVDRPERLLVDPADHGLFASVGIHRISNDGSLLAYELGVGGEERKAIGFVDVESGRVLEDRVGTGYVRGLVITPGNQGYFYCQETSSVTDEHTIRLHLFHKSVADQVVFREARSCESRLVLTADDVHLGAIWTHQEEQEVLLDFWIATVHDPEHWHQVFAGRRMPFRPLLKYGRIFAISYIDAPNGTVAEFDKDGREVQVIVSEQDQMIRQLVFARDRIFASYAGGSSIGVQRWNVSGQDMEFVDIPSDGTVQILSNQNEECEGFFYTYESFDQPRTIYEYLPESNHSRLWHGSQSPAEKSNFEAQGVEYTSKDGAGIPMTLVRRRGFDLGHRSAVIMTSYGGFGVAVTPQFSVFVSILLEAGAIFAIPHIRGGGEFGKAWYDAARGRKRQTSFDDFLAAAEWLCDQGITVPRRIGIFGGSNSGLLVGAAMTQRPDLFGAVLSIAPLLDMVRYERFDQAAKWRQEYGTVDDPEDFKALYGYSPYHHVEGDIDYPPVLFVSGDKDDRCNPAHVRKMAARLQQRVAQRRPVLVDYSEQRGHSPTLPLSVRVEALSRRVAFFAKELHISIAAGGKDETVDH